MEIDDDGGDDDDDATSQVHLSFFPAALLFNSNPFPNLYSRPAWCWPLGGESCSITLFFFVNEVGDFELTNTFRLP